MKVPGAPNNRSLIRQARVLAEDESYKFNPEAWVWPDSVVGVVEKQGSQPPAKPNPAIAPPQVVVGAAEQAAGQGSQLAGASTGSDASAKEGAGNGSQEPASVEQTGGAKLAGAPNVPQTQTAVPPSNAGAGAETVESASSTQPQETNESPSNQAAASPIIMVEFKMGAEAKTMFTGELLVSRKPKATSAGVVAYLNEEGREEVIEVPLAHIALVSINHS